MIIGGTIVAVLGVTVMLTIMGIVLKMVDPNVVARKLAEKQQQEQ